jgi:hypothetical protein
VILASLQRHNSCGGRYTPLPLVPVTDCEHDGHDRGPSDHAQHGDCHPVILFLVAPWRERVQYGGGNGPCVLCIIVSLSAAQAATYHFKDVLRPFRHERGLSAKLADGYGAGSVSRRFFPNPDYARRIKICFIARTSGRFPGNFDLLTFYDF